MSYEKAVKKAKEIVAGEEEPFKSIAFGVILSRILDCPGSIDNAGRNRLSESPNIKIRQQKPSEEELPPQVVKWILQEKSKLSFKELTLVILYHRGKDGLTKADLEAESGRAGVNTRKYHDWLDKTLMSSHGGMKGLVVSTTLKTSAKIYSLTTFGRQESGKRRNSIPNKSLQLRSCFFLSPLISSNRE
jgi:hypothetical protein